MSTLLNVAVARPAGGAPIVDILVVGLTTTLLTGFTLAEVSAYRAGRARRLRRLLAVLERVVGVPGWAALPGLGAIAFALVTIWGATWDIGLHIDVGRDPGPLGTVAHYPLLLGLLGMFLMGVLALGIAPDDPRHSSSVAIRLGSFGRAPAAGVLLSAASAFALLGFPLDDQWHRIFGQDVTLWGPTHTMFIGGVMAAGVGATLLLVEGARAAGREPFRGAGGLLRRPLPALLAAIFLYLWTAALHEFNWGVPQYREIWQPMLLAFGGAHAFVLARVLAGRGGTLGALAIWLPMQVAMSLVIGGPLHTTMPAMPLFVAEALIVEALAARGDWRDSVRFGAIAGLGVGTLGFAAEYGWSHVVMPLPWGPPLLDEAIPVAALAGLSGGVLGALMAQALTGSLRSGRRAFVVACAAGLLAIGLGVNAAVTSSPAGVTATVTTSHPRTAVAPGGRVTQVADVSVRLSRPSLGKSPEWAYVLAWQGGGRFMSQLVRQPDGSLRSSLPVPVGGNWKSFVRVHKGRTMLAAPIRMPADPVIRFAGFPLERQVTRPMVADTILLQIERKRDVPRWAFTAGQLLVLGLDLMLVVLMAAICVRLGRMAGTSTGRSSRRGSPVGRETGRSSLLPVPSPRELAHLLKAVGRP